MKHWQIVIVIYCGIAFVWSLYTLFRYHKFQKSKNFKSEKNLIFVFFLGFSVGRDGDGCSYLLFDGIRS